MSASEVERRPSFTSAIDEDLSGESKQTCYNLKWTIGMDSSVPLLNLSINEKTRYFYVSGNVGVIGTGSGKRQTVLQGHISKIVSAAVSDDRRWLVTAESIPEIFLIIWDTYTGKPMKYLKHEEKTGIVRVIISTDGKSIALLTDVPDQKIIVWRWMINDVRPMMFSKISNQCERQTWFSMIEDRSFYCSVGNDSAIFYSKANADDNDKQRFCVVSPKDTGRVHVEIHQNIQQQLGQRPSPIIFCYLIPGKREAVVLTSIGKAVFFEVDLNNVTSKTNTNVLRRTSMKRLHDLQRHITCIALTKDHLLIGTPQSQVVVYDFNLKLIKQYPSLNIGPLRSIGINQNIQEKEEPTIQDKWAQTSNMIETSLQLHEAICQSDQTILVAHRNFSLIKIVQTIPKGQITDICFHPIASILFVGTSIGHLHAWDGGARSFFLDKPISNANDIGVSKIALNKSCSHLAIGLENGLIWIYDAMYKPIFSRALINSQSAVLDLQFSPSDIFLAAVSTDKGISLYARDRTRLNLYHILGRIIGHIGRITAIVFVQDRLNKNECLFSSGIDGDLIEYVLDDQTQNSFNIQKRNNLVEYPTFIHSLALFPIDSQSNHDHLICSLSNGRIKFFDLLSKQCQHTVQALYSPFEQVKIWLANCEEEPRGTYLAFRTFDCIGAMMLPGTGHPNEYDMILAHYGGIRSFEVAINQSLLMSCGTTDNCVFVWKLDTECLKSQEIHRLETSIPLKDLESLFYYIQLQDPSQLSIHATIALPLISDFARAQGIQPSERQLEELYNEQCTKKKKTDPKDIQIDFNETIRIFYNHFANPADSTSLSSMLNLIFDEYQSSDSTKLDLRELIDILMTEGEKMSWDEIHQAFRTLGMFDDESTTIDSLPNDLDRQQFLNIFNIQYKLEKSDG